MTEAAATRARLTRSAAYASISVAILLIGLKLWAVGETGSTAMLGSLADSALDLFASLATLAGVWIAARPADEDYRFGHGKAEALAAMLQVVLISLSAFGLAIRAIAQWIDGGRVAAAEEGVVVSVIAILATLALLLWQRRVIRRTGSLAIKADHLHYKSDLLLNLAVIAALLLDARLGIAGADPIFGLAIALWLGWSASRSAAEAVGHLMDREWPEEQRRQFVELAAQRPELTNLHDLRTRHSGNLAFAQFHVDLPGEMTIREAHEIIERVEADLTSQFPNLELLIHIDPQGHVDEPGNRLVEEDEFGKLEDRR